MYVLQEKDTEIEFNGSECPVENTWGVTKFPFRSGNDWSGTCQGKP